MKRRFSLRSSSPSYLPASCLEEERGEEEGGDSSEQVDATEVWGRDFVLFSCVFTYQVLARGSFTKSFLEFSRHVSLRFLLGSRVEVLLYSYPSNDRVEVSAQKPACADGSFLKVEDEEEKEDEEEELDEKLCICAHLDPFQPGFSFFLSGMNGRMSVAQADACVKREEKGKKVFEGDDSPRRLDCVSEENSWDAQAGGGGSKFRGREGQVSPPLVVK